ncbi:N-acetylmuramoyl-L-alanine amidase [Gleimia coleocanis DSM 15436]|uniref:N-acetylmuramoyl-L-alanine amidase n=1 Tax=Gleimia coleocanis DSM 15436 TaxID=525245 RepID=C0VY94_9ACTO|nr:peptidoglycan recognition family protein [Gleimia coleocanis]EEH64397.1 N-acetylmuramoyl-L-alanine amidase [Gleimia coleocanis DSM 15436]
MTKYPFKLITSITSPNDSGTRPLSWITHIDIHHWGPPDAGLRIEGVTAHLCNPNAKDRYGNPAPVSSHLVVSAGIVYQIVDFSRIAWHAYPDNEHSIGIECNPRCSKDDFETVAQSIAYCWDLIGRIVPLQGHKDANPALGTECPGRYYPRLKELYNLALKYYRRATKTQPKPTTLPRKKGKKMLFVYLKDYSTGSHKPGSGHLYALVGSGFFCRFTGQAQANRFAEEYGNAVEVTDSMWNALADSAKSGSNSSGYRDSVDADISRIANAVVGE